MVGFLLLDNLSRALAFRCRPESLHITSKLCFQFHLFLFPGFRWHSRRVPPPPAQNFMMKSANYVGSPRLSHLSSFDCKASNSTIWIKSQHFEPYTLPVLGFLLYHRLFIIGPSIEPSRLHHASLPAPGWQTPSFRPTIPPVDWRAYIFIEVVPPDCVLRLSYRDPRGCSSTIIRFHTCCQTEVISQRGIPLDQFG